MSDVKLCSFCGSETRCVNDACPSQIPDDRNARPAPALTPSPQAWVCAKCGAGSVEHGMPNNPSYQCAYEPTLITVPGALTPKQAAAVEMFDALAKVKREWPHEAPGDCYSTGPLTGDPIADYVVCPGCDVLRAIEAALAKAGRA